MLLTRKTKKKKFCYILELDPPSISAPAPCRELCSSISLQGTDDPTIHSRSFYDNCPSFPQHSFGNRVSFLSPGRQPPNKNSIESHVCKQPLRREDHDPEPKPCALCDQNKNDIVISTMVIVSARLTKNISQNIFPVETPPLLSQNVIFHTIKNTLPSVTCMRFNRVAICDMYAI